jgi:DNA-binding IclR family transcriptional regulator
MVYLNVVESNQRVMLAVPIGQRPPAFCTASGKSCLGLFTPNTINSRETYLEY